MGRHPLFRSRFILSPTGSWGGALVRLAFVATLGLTGATADQLLKYEPPGDEVRRQRTL